MSLSFWICPILVLCINTLVNAVDVQPPEVPNPWNTSEQRALTDHLAECYHITVSPQLPLDQLRARYRIAWNKDQETRLQEGREVDQKFAAAVKRETELQERDNIIAEFERNGVHPDHTLTTEQLQIQIKVLKDNKAAVAAKEAELKRASEDEAAERAARLMQQKATEKQMPGGKNIIALRARTLADDLPDRQKILERLTTIFFSPNHTQRERENVQLCMQGIADDITQVRAAGIFAGTTGNGVEVWCLLTTDEHDPEYALPTMVIVNLTTRAVEANDTWLSFIGSTRNTEMKSWRPVRADWRIAEPGQCLRIKLPRVYLDPGQTVTPNIELTPSDFRR